MKLSYSQMRQVLSILAKNKQVKEALANIGKEAGNITPLGFIDVLVESKIDLEILEILTRKDPEGLDFTEAVEVFTGFFTDIKESWHLLAPLLPNSVSLEKAKKATNTP